ncbi:hypothetical protein ACFFGH_07255 [Lysobacter korlensis]|uniref:Uncharacterized protein n=1 Tax=Lysobacter korlensis TaxID=553636 RepID=A0ABV6RKY5_9GAMM
MSLWIAVVVVVLGIWLALKAVGALVRLALVIVVIAAVYWLIAPHLGLPMLWG